MLSSLTKGSSSQNITQFARTYLQKRDPNDKRSEQEKMLAGDYYDSMDPHLYQLRENCRLLMEEYNLRTTIKDLDKRTKVLNKLFGAEYKGIYIEPPVYFDYGTNTTFGENCYMNYGCTILDVNKVTIGDNCLFAPNVSIFTATHPTDVRERLAMAEYGLPIKIGNNCWIGGGAIICPGVTLGDNVVVAAGAVVNKDVPSDCIVAGNPARIIKRMEPYKYVKKE
ncbi:transferase [Tritrichomonas foetus]|uniref:Transferase n=1 Tax=Tritrichomonas foetus TaxID=1144522 RepID=A0A1J4KRK9_9EUKA|nr:transferase [Tritrichomonas foetus]|eukprot:OHT13929.1 transferase [Tritrichomonas foetus]